MYDATKTIQQFLDAAAAKQPAPGGGSVTALVGALAAAMGEMSLNYSLGKKNLAAFDPELRSSLAEFDRLRAMMLQLMIEDQAAYETISALRKLPEESAERKERYEPTLLACIRVPEAMAAGGVAALELCRRLVEKTNVFLLSDLAVCAELAMATVRCGIHNVRVNLADVVDPDDLDSMRSTTAALLARATEIIREVIPAIWHRIEGR
jgi:formiminotetrahydrofolate cyclodeaminase